MKFQLIDVGRDKCNAVIEADSVDDLPELIRKRAKLMSRDVSILWDEDEFEGEVQVGFCRPVGMVRSLEFGAERRKVRDA